MAIKWSYSYLISYEYTYIPKPKTIKLILTPLIIPIY